MQYGIKSRPYLVFLYFGAIVVAKGGLWGLGPTVCVVCFFKLLNTPKLVFGWGGGSSIPLPIPFPLDADAFGVSILAPPVPRLSAPLPPNTNSWLRLCLELSALLFLSLCRWSFYTMQSTDQNALVNKACVM